MEGYPVSKLPSWLGCEARVLCSPEMGANFAMYLIDVPAGRGSHREPDDLVESFVYVLSGEIAVAGKRLGAAGFAFVPDSAPLELSARKFSQLLFLRKSYEPAGDSKLDGHAKVVLGNAPRIRGVPYFGNRSVQLQKLLPDDLRHDLAINIFTMQPGHGLPCIETHVMEHGLYMLEGKGVYYLDGEWMEVEKDDFIWMGPYCPQSFYATGPAPAKYIYYKNVNREIAL
jgi:(S)-ureidoglycine aminohydrolase